MVIGSLISLVIGYTTPLWEPGEYEATKTEIWTPESGAIAEEIDFYRGTWERQILYRAPQAFQMETTVFLFETFWKVAGLMLIGMALYKRRVFNAKQSVKYYSKMMGYGLGIGLPLVIGGVILDFNYDWDFRLRFFFFSQLNYWGLYINGTGVYRYRYDHHQDLNAKLYCKAPFRCRQNGPKYLSNAVHNLWVLLLWSWTSPFRRPRPFCSSGFCTRYLGI